MTAKRFTHKEDDWEILDNGRHFAYAHSDYQAEKLCDKLNELAEENTHIKNTIKELYQTERTQIGKNTLKQLIEAIQ